METKIFQHFNPVWRDRADFIIFAKVPPIGESTNVESFEQLWGKKISDHYFEICCIPMFTYNLSLGDEVETDTDFLITKVVKPSGHYTFRVWLKKASQTFREKFTKVLNDKELLVEWYSENLLGIDAISEKQAKLLAQILSDYQQKEGIVYETGKV